MPPIRHDRQNASKRPSMNDIFDGPDEFGLLDVQAKRISKSAPLEVTNFEAINAFVDQRGRLPSHDSDLSEKLLARRLAGFQGNLELHAILKPYDRHCLLLNPVIGHKEADDSTCALTENNPSLGESSADNADAFIDAESVTSLDDIFASADFGMLDQGDQSIFDLTHVPAVTDRESPDEIAQRKVCHDYYKFEHIFDNLHEGLKTRQVKTVRFQQASQVAEGDTFILEGVLCLVDEVGEHRVDSQGRYDPRLRVIFENGTESNHLLQSLAKRLYLDETGRRVVRDADSVVDAFNNISHRDKRAGQIYFVATLSDNPTLKAVPHLIKIGYTELTVEERIKNAVRDIAFLESPVKILASIECYNLSPHKFESLIHGFLHAQRLRMTLTGKDGKAYNPKEWFSVPLDTAREVVRRIIDGSIVHYRMDNTNGRIVKKQS